MDDTLKQFITNSPTTAAVVLVVWMFMKELRVQRNEYFNESAARLNVLRDISNQHNKAYTELQQATNDCSAKVAASLDENTRMLSRVSVTLENCEKLNKNK